MFRPTKASGGFVMQGRLLYGIYRIVRILGRGGTGVVYLAQDIHSGIFYAVKAVNKNTIRKMDLLGEPKILMKLKHSALPKIIDIKEDEQNIYIIKDYVDGISLDREQKMHGIFSEETVINWAVQICDVLLYLHTLKPNPIIYGDMKPANIIVTKDNRIKIIDFGIARECKNNKENDILCMGTRGYAAPEQYGKYGIDGRADIYGLGSTLYHLVTGENPEEPPCSIKPVRQLNSKLSYGIEYIIFKCTRHSRLQRYQSVNELLADLNNIKTLDRGYVEKFSKYYMDKMNKDNMKQAKADCGRRAWKSNGNAEPTSSLDSRVNGNLKDLEVSYEGSGMGTEQL